MKLQGSLRLSGSLAIYTVFSGLLIGCSTSTGIEGEAVEQRGTTVASAASGKLDEDNVSQQEENQQTLEQPVDRNMPVAIIRALSTEVAAGEPIKIEFSIENTTGPEVSVLPWGSPLESELTGPAFNIVRIDADGVSTDIPYGGVMIRRAAPTANDYVVLPIGGRLVNTLSLDDSYSLNELGTYQISFKASESSASNVFTMGETEVYMQNGDLTVIRK